MPRYSKKYKQLRWMLFDKGYDHGYFAKSVGMGKTNFSEKISGKRPFILTEVYAICNKLDIPLNDIPVYFPQEDQPSR